MISTDEMTGVQALERAAPGLPLRPGKVERREFEYIRHGTLSFMINFDVVSGKVVCPSVGPTRTEVDFAAHVRQTVRTFKPTRSFVFNPVHNIMGNVPPENVVAMFDAAYAECFFT